MATCNRLFFLVVKVIFISAFPDLQAQKLEMQPEVTGYVGQEVILKCQFIPGTGLSKLAQVQWGLVSNERNITILVFSTELGINIEESPLKERVNFTEDSLTIKDVKMTDSGSYTCSVTTFPSGSFKKTTKLVVRTEQLSESASEQNQLSAGILCAIIISAVLLLGILTAAAYLTFVRRHKAARRLEVHIDTSSRVASVNRPSYIYKDPVSTEEVLYADVKPKRIRNSGSSLNKIPRASAKAEEVTYAEVKVYHQRPNLETVFSV